MTASRFSVWLGKQLKARDWVQSDLARALKVGNGTVSRWMNGQRPDTQYIERIADVLQADVDMLLTMAGHRPATEPIDPDDPKADVMAMLKRVRIDAGRARTLRAILSGYVEDDRVARERER